MGNNKGSGIFLGVIGVATLVVAIIGATFAFFGANISSPEGAVTVSSTTLSLGYSDVTTGLKTNLIPAEHWIATYAGTQQMSQAEIDAKKLEDQDFTYNGNLQCIDDNGNEVCGVYTFTIGNPSFTTAQDLYGSIKVVSNDFTDLFFSIYDESGTQVVAPTRFVSTDKNGGVMDLTDLNQKLLASTSDANKTPEGNDADGFDSTDPKTYTKVTGTCQNADGEDYTCSNVRTYKMVIWIEETKTDQTEQSGKTFAASVTFTTASGTSGVSGVIAAADDAKPENTPENPVEPTEPEESGD